MAHHHALMKDRCLLGADGNGRFDVAARAILEPRARAEKSVKYVLILIESNNIPEIRHNNDSLTIGGRRILDHHR
jgi:hypothetical protein